MDLILAQCAPAKALTQVSSDTDIQPEQGLVIALLLLLSVHLKSA